ncbi:MAG: retropepsin-like domain-containing protein [Patescibacteria group bacterium]|nr:retropepsin-like domain-containing protein [Patescibacteria group bacterium]
MKFSYLEVVGPKDTRGKSVKRPVLMIELKTQDGSVLEVPAVIDSGADTTAVNMEYAEPLGIKLNDAKEILGIGKGKVPTKIGNLPFKIKHTDIEIDVPAWYIDSENVGILLGQEVFFENFRISFEKNHNTFELTKNRK